MTWTVTNVYIDSAILRERNTTRPPIEVHFKPGSPEEHKFLAYKAKQTLLEVDIRISSCNGCKFLNECKGPQDCINHIMVEDRQ